MPTSRPQPPPAHASSRQCRGSPSRECFGVLGRGRRSRGSGRRDPNLPRRSESPRGAQTPANWGEHKVNRGIIRGDRERRRDVSGGGRRRPKQRAAPALAQNRDRSFRARARAGGSRGDGSSGVRQMAIVRSHRGARQHVAIAYARVRRPGAIAGIPVTGGDGSTSYAREGTRSHARSTENRALHAHRAIERANMIRIACTSSRTTPVAFAHPQHALCCCAANVVTSTSRFEGFSYKYCRPD